MMKIQTVLLVFISYFAVAHDQYPRNNNIDVKHYTFRLEVNDSTDVLNGEATVTIAFLKPLAEFELDLITKNGAGKGMQVKEVKQDGISLKFFHQNNRLKIILPAQKKRSGQHSFSIGYSGIPEEGLVISKNKFGDRTFFGDNWPDRGHHWLPIIDHPSDKAQVEFIITAPEHYQVIATGKKIGEQSLSGKRKLTHWKESIDVPVKVMTMGVARFAIQQSGEVNHIPVTTWVFPQNRDAGFSDFAVAPKILKFFNDNIGPFAYEKLAHVQSKTRWGGLENASNIFYAENSVTGKNEIEELIAHETAHQWFGNSVSENDWHHVWLSEGFATYFSNLYMENTYGRSKLDTLAKKQREEVIAYFKKSPAPIVDTTITEIDKVLSTNTYQKAGWVLHMLRHEIGDTLFWKGIRTYYHTYQNGNALTSDFQAIMESVSGKNLAGFFSQWFYNPGHPVLEVTSSYDPATKTINLTVHQKQGGSLFKIPFEIAFYLPGTATPQIERIRIDREIGNFSIPVSQKPLKIVLDPGINLLFEEKTMN